ncbi:MAG: cobalt ECF transporter T component CbiQ [Actinomycetota bacterium]|nr:MAG: cobalt ECF transporter T component CbiQ [Actinomycetota bacterium]
MGAGHGHGVAEGLYLPGSSLVHRLPAHLKLVAVLAFVLVVVCTPPTRVPAFAAYLALLVAVALLARVPLPTVAARSLIELPFVLFAVLMPLLGPDPRVDVLGLSLSQNGLQSAWGIIAKGTLGVFASVLLAATTPARDLIAGLERLRVPTLLVQIASFMLRYSVVVVEQSRRMAVARASRGFAARGPRAWPVLARAAGTLFIRSYERGERVHLAMLSRGYDGTMPLGGAVVVRPIDWLAVLVLPLLAAAVLLATAMMWR